MNHEIYVVGVGGCSALGASAKMSAAAVRAKLTRFEEFPDEVAGRQEPVLVAQAGFLDDNRLSERFKSLLSLSLEEALACLPATKTARGIRALVTLPLPRPGLPEDIVETLRQVVDRVSAGGWSFANPAFARLGHAGALSGLSRVAELLATGGEGLVLLAGVDSYVDKETLAGLCAAGRLVGDELDDGFVPGEGAGACLLCDKATMKKLGLKPIGRLLSFGIGKELATRDSDEPGLGLGLTDALDAALQGVAEGTKIAQIFADLNCESYRTDEWVFATLRLGERFENTRQLIQPSYFWGDVGAASGPLLIMLAVSPGFTIGSESLQMLVTSSDSALRACAVIMPNS